MRVVWLVVMVNDVMVMMMVSHVIDMGVMMVVHMGMMVDMMVYMAVREMVMMTLEVFGAWWEKVPGWLTGIIDFNNGTSVRGLMMVMSVSRVV